jgi:hypothetical protein
MGGRWGGGDGKNVPVSVFNMYKGAVVVQSLHVPMKIYLKSWMGKNNGNFHLLNIYWGTTMIHNYSVFSYTYEYLS